MVAECGLADFDFHLGGLCFARQGRCFRAFRWILTSRSSKCTLMRCILTWAMSSYTSLGVPWASPGRALGLLWGSLGLLWASLGLPWASLGPLLGFLWPSGAPLGPYLGLLWAPCGLFGLLLASLWCVFARNAHHSRTRALFLRNHAPDLPAFLRPGTPQK